MRPFYPQGRRDARKQGRRGLSRRRRGRIQLLGGALELESGQGVGARVAARSPADRIVGD